jgi:hypothetical protein
LRLGQSIAAVPVYADKAKNILPLAFMHAVASHLVLAATVMIFEVAAGAIVTVGRCSQTVHTQQPSGMLVRFGCRQKVW